MPRKSTKKTGTISISKSPSTHGLKKTPTTASAYNVSAKDVINLKFIKCAEDLEVESITALVLIDPIYFNPNFLAFFVRYNKQQSRSGFFRPVYTHQLFEKERILGYKDLRINIFFTQPHLYTYIDIEYSDKLNENEYEVSDIAGTFAKWLKGGFTQDRREFIKVE